MKIVREHINEKFIEDSDPIHDLGIGVLYEITLYVTERFYNKEFKKFLKKNYIKVKPGKDEELNRKDWYRFIGTKDSLEKLRKEYFVYLKPLENIRNFKKLNEKFTEDSDPVQDMGIGLRTFLKKEMEKETIMNPGIAYREYFKIYCNDSYNEYYYHIVRILWQTIKYYVNKEFSSIQDSFESSCRYEFHDESFNTKIKLKLKKKIAQILKKKYHVNVDPLYESLNEKFTEDDSDPIKDLNIGQIHKIREWIQYVSTTKGRGQFGGSNKIDSNIKINNDNTIDVGDPNNIDILIQQLKGLRIKDKSIEPIILRGDNFSELPDFINFNICYGDCFMNVGNWKSLRGCPRIVYGSFCINCNDNLNSFEYFPEIIYGNAYIDRRLESKAEEINKKCKFIIGKLKLF